MYVKNAWYVACWAKDLIHEFRQMTIMDQPILMYRTQSGQAVALEDRCCHRRVPLSCGELVGDNVQCGYHGFTFNSAGACVAIPNQESIPQAARVRAYSLCEKHHLVWIWMGDTAQADEGLVPDFSILSNPTHAWKGDYLHVDANYRLVTDNLNDLSHLTFVHRTTIGNSATALATIDVESTDHNVIQTRWMIDTPPPPTYQRLLGFKENIDRWQVITFSPPGAVQIRTGARRKSTGEKAIGGEGSVGMYALHAITPESPTTSHYFWGQTHDFRIDEPEVTESLFRDIQRAFSEDVKIFAAQQTAINQDVNHEEVSCRADRPQIMARRLVDRLLEAEAALNS